MKVVKQFQSALVALLAVLALGACAQSGTSSRPTGVTYDFTNAHATAQKPATSRQPSTAVATPVQSQGNPASAEFPGSPVAEAQIDTGTFPTSKAKPAGKPWTVMHPSGFTGDYAVAGQLMGLTPVQVKKYANLHSAGMCKVMDVPNGVVLDRLTFTRDGKHHVQASVKVDLKKPPTRKAEVCDLGDGVIAIRFHGCNNHALVRGWVPAKVTVVVPVGTCQKFVQVHVWASSALALPGVQKSVDDEAARPNDHFNPLAVSRLHGPMLRTSATASTVGREVVVNFRGVETFRGVVTGVGKIPVPVDIGPEEVLQILFPDKARIISPHRDLQSKGKEIRACLNAAHAIERANQQ